MNALVQAHTGRVLTYLLREMGSLHMDETAVANWLDSTFAAFDSSVLEAVHNLAVSTAETLLAPLMWIISFTGEVGALSLAVSILLIFFKKTRKVGVCMLVAIIIGALFTNVLLKNLVARDRPFEASPLFFEWWQSMGAMEVSDRSFPSGHVTAATAAVVALIISSKKAPSWLALIYVALMMLSRMYFVVHYPTDVLGGLIVGLIAASLSCWIVGYIFKKIRRRKRLLDSQKHRDEMLVAVSDAAAAGAAGVVATTNNTPEATNWDLVKDAYIFTLPLMLMDASATVFTNVEESSSKGAPINQLGHATHLMDASFTDVVTPNVDTIYSQAWLDLSNDALVFHKPASKRFLSVQILDFFTNAVAILGSGGDTQDERSYVLTGPHWKGEVPKGITRIALPTNGAWILVRTIVSDEADLKEVASLQQHLHLVPLSSLLNSSTPYQAPKGEVRAERSFVPVKWVLGLDPQAYFSRANELMLSNPPAAADAEILARMARINVGPGLTFNSTVLGEDSSTQWAELQKNLEPALLSDSLQFTQVRGCWHFFGKPIAEYGTEYSFRALVALVGLGANPVEVAVYPKASTDSAGKPLIGATGYRIHFEKDLLPPVEEQGFWSITAYGEDNFLIDNAINRYAVNDRSSFSYNQDGSLDIYVQTNEPEDNALKGNWLPVKEEQFHLYLRIYLPSQAALDGSWIPPTITPLS